MAQNKNGPIIGLAIFILLSVVFAVGWYMTYSDNQTTSSALLAAQNKTQDLEGTVKALNADLDTMKGLIGEGQNEDVGTGEAAAADTINGRVTAMLQDLGGDGTDVPASLMSGVLKESAANYANTQSANDRQQLLALRTREYQQMVTSKDGEIVQIQDALTQAEEKLKTQEVNHSEELAQREATIDALSKEKSDLDRLLADVRVQSQRVIDGLNQDVAAKRQAIIDLRKRLVQQEDLTFARPDGLITSVDQSSKLCYVDIGEADGLQTGVTFSVYSQENSGVGRNNTSEIKGKIEIVDILGPHRAEGRIVTQEPGLPIATDDPIYSPIFQTGQSLEVVIAGRVSVDGLNRQQLRRLVTAAGARIVSEVDDEGQFADGRGNPITREEAAARITSNTRFIVIADQGDQDSADGKVVELSRTIRQSTQVLKDKALNLGIHEIGLATFLEHIGYSRKQISWTQESQRPFPGKLVNGARSSQVNSSYGRRESGGAVSGLFYPDRRKRTESYGQTSGVYSEQ